MRPRSEVIPSGNPVEYVGSQSPIRRRVQGRRFVTELSGMVVLLLGTTFAFASETRDIGSDNSYLIKGADRQAKKKIGRASRRHGKNKIPLESNRSDSGKQGSPLIKGKAEALNADLLEKQIPEIASLLEKIAANSEDASSHFDLATCYHRRGVLDKALEECQKAVGLDSGNAEYHEELARIWKDGGIPKSSLEELEKTLQIKPDSVSAWNLMGTLFDDQGDLAQASTCYLKALSFKPDLDYLHSNLSFVYSRTGALEDAILHGEEAIRLNPDNKVAHNNLGIAYALAGNNELALEEFRQGGDRASAHNNLGLVLLKQQKLDEAMEQFRIAIRLKPFYRLAAENYRLARSLKTALEKQNGKPVSKGDPERG